MGEQVLLHPMVLSRLALLLMDIDRVSKGKDPKPIIIDVDSEADETCTVRGIVLSDLRTREKRRDVREALKPCSGGMAHDSENDSEADETCTVRVEPAVTSGGCVSVLN